MKISQTEKVRKGKTRDWRFHACYLLHKTNNHEVKNLRKREIEEHKAARLKYGNKPSIMG